MAAIYGEIGIHEENEYKKYFNNYKFDSFKELVYDNVLFSCYHQYFTKEDEYELMPRKNDSILIMCDVILDNRDELIRIFSVGNDIADSVLVELSYKKWGTDCPRYLYGDFAFAIYDFNQDFLFLARDQLGKKILYYTFTGGSFKFSTIIGSISQNQSTLNKSYLRKMIAVNMVMNNPTEDETIYEKIFMLKPAHTLILKDNNIITKCYWNLKKTKKYKSVEEAYSDFRNVYSKAISSCLRTNGEIGISLSGGLDSSSVVCIAAEILKKDRKKIYGYTSIPDLEYNLNIPRDISFDESNIVKLIDDKLTNLECCFVDSKGKSAISEKCDIEQINEQPVKFLSNGFWIKDIYSLASERGCKILLNGQSGNFCVSYGNTYKYYYSLISRFKFRSFYTIVSQYCKSQSISRKKYFKRIFSEFIKHEKFNILSYINIYNKLNMIELEDLATELKSFHETGKPSTNVNIVLKEMCNPILLNQMAESETKFGLRYKILQRDPTRDVRLIECCYNFPIDAFNFKGYTRTLIKEGLKDIVPREVLQSRVKGVQGGDFLFRIKNEWESQINIVKLQIEENDYLNDYLDVDSFKKILDKYGDIKSSTNLDDRIEISQILSTIYIIDFIVKSKEKEIE